MSRMAQTGSRVRANINAHSHPFGVYLSSHRPVLAWEQIEAPGRADLTRLFRYHSAVLKQGCVNAQSHPAGVGDARRWPLLTQSRTELGLARCVLAAHPWRLRSEERVASRQGGCLGVAGGR